MPCDVEPLQVAHPIRGVAHFAFHLGEALRREVDAPSVGELEQRQRPDDCGVEQEHARVAVLAHDPRVHAARMHAALACDAVGEAERLERGSAAHDRDRTIGPAAGEVLGHHVEGVRHNHCDRWQRTGLDRVGDLGHHPDVLLLDVEPALARKGVVTGGDDEDVFAIDLVESEAARLRCGGAAGARCMKSSARPCALPASRP